MTPEPISDEELAKIANNWLNVCGYCDGGLARSCTCPEDDPRHVIDRLLAEVVRLRASLGVAREQRDNLARIVDPIEPSVPCGDGRCYCCGGCVL